MAAFSFMNRSRTDHQCRCRRRRRRRSSMTIFLVCFFLLRANLYTQLPPSPAHPLPLSHSPSLSHFLFVSLRFIFSAFLSTAQLIKKRFALAFVFTKHTPTPTATQQPDLESRVPTWSSSLRWLFGWLSGFVAALRPCRALRLAHLVWNLTNYLMIDGC